MKRPRGIHELALGAPAKTAADLARTAQIARGLGADTLEFLFNPAITAKEAANAIMESGLQRAHLCLCHLDGKGHPLKVPEREPCVQYLTAAIHHVYDMREEGLKINMVDGPIAVLLGDPNPPPNALERVIEFLGLVTPVARQHEVVLSVELLQRSEDPVIATLANLAKILGAVASAYVKTLLDTYHFARNGQSITEAITAFGADNIGLFHANGVGKDLDTDGRIPCGSDDYDVGDRRVTDTVNWDEIRTALNVERVGCDVIIEPFHEDACAAIPPLRNGVIPVTDHRQLTHSLNNLKKAGVLV